MTQVFTVLLPQLSWGFETFCNKKVGKVSSVAMGAWKRRRLVREGREWILFSRFKEGDRGADSWGKRSKQKENDAASSRQHQTEREDGKGPSLLTRSLQVGRGARRKCGQRRLVQRGCLGGFLCYLHILRAPTAKLRILPQAPQVSLPETPKSQAWGWPAISDSIPLATCFLILSCSKSQDHSLWELSKHSRQDVSFLC